MATKHTISHRDNWFLNKHMRDPVAQEPFKVGDTIVICAKCKTAHYDSSWSMNSNKCCTTGCNHSSQLSFNKFSTMIFQPKTIRNSRFSIIAEKLPFGERIKMFNCYPIANTVTVLIPIILLALVVYTTKFQAVTAFNVTNQMAYTQDKISTFGAESRSKSSSRIEKPGGVEFDFGELDNKISTVSSSFNLVKPKIEDANMTGKLNKSFINLSATASHATTKITGLFSMIADCIKSLFGG